MDHGPSTEWKVEKSGGYKSKLGLIMFAIFTPVYLVFVLMSVISPSFMATDVGELNISIVYGFFIIILAIVLAVFYNILCSNMEKHDDPETHHEERP
jgi:uncharacterized membrane protein (DUF485 family)